jgi:hypothetical protein
MPEYAQANLEIADHCICRGSSGSRHIKPLNANVVV